MFAVPKIEKNIGESVDWCLFQDSLRVGRCAFYTCYSIERCGNELRPFLRTVANMLFLTCKHQVFWTADVVVHHRCAHTIVADKKQVEGFNEIFKLNDEN